MSRRGLTLSNLLCPDHHARPRQAPRRGAPGSPRRPILGLAMHLRTLPVQQACPWLRGLSATPRGIQDGDKEGFFFFDSAHAMWPVNKCVFWAGKRDRKFMN